MKLTHIDGGKVFDWDKASADYAQYRDIYPQKFYQYLLDKGLCCHGQKVLDLGTGTGVLPRHLYAYGAEFTGTDRSATQIDYAKKLSEEAGMSIDYLCAAAEDEIFAEDSFDVVTACQCFFYFNHDRAVPQIHRILKPHGKLILLYMGWLPYEDQIAGASEQLILNYNPSWTGCKDMRHPIELPSQYLTQFQLLSSEVFDLAVPFTRESWHGRIKACRGVDASMNQQELQNFEREHLQLLSQASQTFCIKHYAAISILEAI